MVDIVFDGSITGTGINLGDTTLSDYEEGTFTPTFTFATPGDLSNVYTRQLGFYTRIGRQVFITIDITVTPTFTTSSGNMRIGDLPFTVINTASANNGLVTIVNHSTNLTYGASNTGVTGAFSQGNTFLFLRSIGSGTASVSLSPSNVTSGISTVFTISGFFIV